MRNRTTAALGRRIFLVALAVTTYVKFMLGSYEFASRNRREVA